MFGFRQKVIELSGVKVRMGRHIVPEVRKHFDDGSYEWPELVALKEKLEPDDIVLELGAGIGLLAAYCARAIGSERVFTYEANPQLEPYLRDTFELNGVTPTLEMCLLGGQEGEQLFYVHRAFWESSSLPDGRAAKAITVPCRDINAELERINPTLLVIDIEGGEYDLLKHMRFFYLRKIIIEIHKDKLGLKKTRAVRSILYRAGFRVVRYLSNWDVLYLERL